MDFVIGGLAGAGATILTNPMDVVKTRLQLQGELRARNEHTARYRGVFHALYVIARADGPVALQKGLAPAMLFGFTMNSVRLGLYHVAEVQGWTKNKNGGISVQKAVFWSAASGYLSGVFANPMSVVKTRMQAASHPSIAVGRQHKYKGMTDAVIKIYKTEGMKGYFAGINATCTRLAIGSGAQLTTFSTMKAWLKGLEFGDRLPILTSVIASLMCCVPVAIVETPLDVANTRLMNQGNGGGRVCLGGCGPATSTGLLYNGVLDCLSKIYKKEGLHGLYKGIGPLYIRLAPHTTLSLVIWDVLNNLLLNNK